MRWLVEVTKTGPDVALSKQIFEELGFGIDERDFGGNNVLFHIFSENFFEQVNDYREVWNLVSRLKDLIRSGSQISGIGAVEIDFGNILDFQSDGSFRRYGFICAVAVLDDVLVAIDIRVSSSSPLLSEEELLAREEEMRKQQRVEKASKAAKYILPALKSPKAQTVIELLLGDLTPQQMGHIFDLVQDDLGSRIYELASEREVTRFTRSINHPDVFALESRHIISKQEPPPKPMSKEEANLFIRGVAEGWFNLNCGTKDV